MPLKSMTGFGEGFARAGALAVRVSIRSVNGKTLRVQCALPEGLAERGADLEARVGRRIQRGTVDVRVEAAGLPAPVEPRVDARALRGYLAAWRAVAGPAAPPHPVLLTLPGAVRLEPRAGPLPAAAVRLLARAAGQALDRLERMRLGEGRALSRALDGSRRRLAKAIDEAAEEAPRAAKGAADRLAARVRALAGEAADAAAIARETALLAQKGDVAEEIDRLQSHAAQLGEALASPEPQGRRLDFLAQEVQREASTMGAKALSPRLQEISLGIRLESERIREQAQNVE